ncbi:LysR family transcriptional regulator [Microvirga sp. c23x22]|uniref:LysR family transcriptional regulator n=2 Tax=Microvirga terricola TaxID=2719797 RepID=A0ABX0V7H0_9HYPH|nr:LysR family transcriptional regulator [Microvirga terricola]
MKLANLETFVHLARLRHFGRTAKHLNTTQPAISSRLAALERELGVQLIAREGREFHLTPAGHEALRVIEKMLGDFDGLKLGFTDPENVAITLRIGAIDAIVQTWLPRLYDRLRQTYPGVQIEIVTDSTVNLLHHMKNGELDITFCLDPILEEGYRSFVVCSYAMSWVGSPKLVDEDRIYTVAELGTMPLITFQRGSPPYRMIAPYFQDESVLASQLSNSNSLPTMIRLAMDGFGIAAVPTIVVEKELDSGDLASVQVNKPFPPLTFIASYHPVPGSLLTERVAELAKRTAAEFCSETVPGLAWVDYNLR